MPNVKNFCNFFKSKSHKMVEFNQISSLFILWGNAFCSSSKAILGLFDHKKKEERDESMKTQRRS